MAISCSFLSKISSSFTSSPLSSPSYSSLALFLIPLCVVSLQPLHLSLYTNFTPAASTTVFCRDGNLLPIPANYEPSSVKKCSPSIGYKKYRVPYPMLIISLLFILTVPTVSDSTDNYIYDNWSLGTFFLSYIGGSPHYLCSYHWASSPITAFLF